jgi:hypothetical protein
MQGAQADPEAPLALYEDGALWDVVVLERKGGRVRVEHLDDGRKRWVNPVCLVDAEGGTCPPEGDPLVSDAAFVEQVVLLMEEHGDPASLAAAIRARQDLWGAHDPPEQTRRMALLAAEVPQPVLIELSRDLPGSAAAWLDAVEVGPNAAGGLGPGLLVPLVAALAEPLVGPLIAAEERVLGPPIAFIDGFLVGCESQLDPETLRQVQVKIAEAGALNTVFPPIFVAGALHGAGEELTELVELMMHLPETLAALQELAGLLLSESGAEVARKLGQETGRTLGADIASVAVKSVPEACYWMGRKAGPLLLDLLLGVLTETYVVPLLLKGLEKGADSLAAVRRLAELVDAMNPRLAPAGGPDFIPDRDLPDSTRARGRDERHLAAMRGEDWDELEFPQETGGGDERWRRAVGDAPEEDLHEATARQAGMPKGDKYPRGLRPEAAFDQLLGDKEFGAYWRLIQELGLAGRADALAAMPDPSGKTVRHVRHTLKEGLDLNERIVAAMFEGPDGKLDAEASHARMLELTRKLNDAPSDKGNLCEAWYGRWSETFEHVKLEAHPQLWLDERGMPLPRETVRGRSAAELKELGYKAAKRPDFVDGDTLVEVKSTGQGLGSRDVTGLASYLRAARDMDGHVWVGGRPRDVRAVKLVFTDVEGARGSLRNGEFRRVWKQYKKELKVEVFIDGKPRVFSTFEDMASALGG